MKKHSPDQALSKALDELQKARGAKSKVSARSKNRLSAFIKELEKDPDAKALLNTRRAMKPNAAMPPKSRLTSRQTQTACTFANNLFLDFEEQSQSQIFLHKRKEFHTSLSSYKTYRTGIKKYFEVLNKGLSEIHAQNEALKKITCSGGRGRFPGAKTAIKLRLIIEILNKNPEVKAFLLKKKSSKT